MSSVEVFNKEFGPILYALGQKDGQAHFRILYYSGKKPNITAEGAPVSAKSVDQSRGGEFWVAEFGIEQQTDNRLTRYEVNGQHFEFVVPSTDCPNLRLAYAACNGSEADSPQAALGPERVKLWEEISKTHDNSAFHCLIMGGDQLYADSIWRDIPFLCDWQKLPRREQYRLEVPSEVKDQMRSYYLACYLTYWSQPGIREVLAKIPSVMIWDDHDIFDGWGSWNARYQASPVYQALFEAAREAFYLFQRGCRAPENQAHAGLLIHLGRTSILVPDLRSERSRQQVMGLQGWAWLQKALLEVPLNNRHLVFVSSVPLATSHFSALDPILTGFPSFIAKRLPKKINPKQFADDIHDQWRVPAHRGEWKRLLHRLLDFSEQNSIRVTTLSGEIHLGARSTIRRGASTIHQFISSGVAHKPANAFVVWCCEWLSKGVQDIDAHIDIRMERFFPSGKKRYLRARNWLSLDLYDRQPATDATTVGGSLHQQHPAHELFATWHAEDLPPVVFRD